MDIGIVMPVYNLCDHRFNNLRYNLISLEGVADKIMIYVIEQHSKNTKISELIDRFSFVKFIDYDLKIDYFNKSLLINKFMEINTHEFIWLLDIDTSLDYKYVIENIPEDASLIKPFDKIFILTEKETKNLQNTNKLILETSTKKAYSSFSKYSFIIKNDLYKQIGGFDKNFTGWGFQDLDLFKRIPRNLKIGYTDNVAFHMYHVGASREFYSKNKELFYKKHNKKLVPKKILDKRKNII